MPSRPSLFDEVDHAPAVHGVEPGHRLVEQQHVGVVRDRLRDLDALPHALAVAAELAVLRVRERDRARAPPARAARHSASSNPDSRSRPATNCRPVRSSQNASGSGTEPDAVEDLGRAPGRPAEQAHLALAGRELARRELQEGRLAGAVRAQQAGDAGRERRGHVVQRDDRPVPARGADELDGRGAATTGAALIARSPPRARACAAPAATPAQTATRASAGHIQCERVASRGAPSSASPTALMHACTDIRIARGQCAITPTMPCTMLEAHHQAEEREPRHARAAWTARTPPAPAG